MIEETDAAEETDATEDLRGGGADVSPPVDSG